MRATEAAPSGVADSAFTYLWKIVRDQQARGDGQEIAVLSSGALIVLRGARPIIAIDRQVGEVLAFIATDVFAEESATRLVPIILGLSHQGPPAPAGCFHRNRPKSELIRRNVFYSLLITSRSLR